MNASPFSSKGDELDYDDYITLNEDIMVTPIYRFAEIVQATSKLIKSLKGGKTYQVKVRAIKKVNKTTFYGKWTAIKSLKVKS